MVKKKNLRKGRAGSADVLRSESTDFDHSSGGLEYEPLHVDADMITSLLARPLYGSFLIETMVGIWFLCWGWGYVWFYLGVLVGDIFFFFLFSFCFLMYFYSTV